MKTIRALVALFLISVFLSQGAYATTSSINPTQPAQNAPLLSSTIRALAQAAYNDITALYALLTVGANQFIGSLGGGQAGPITIPNCPAGLGYVSGGGFICASGAGITALSGDVTATGPGSVSAALANTATARNDIGLGTASTPAFAGLSLTGVENINLNSGALLTALTGTVLHLGNANTTINRIQLDAFGAASHVSAVRADGTAASPTAVQSGEVLGSFNGWGFDGTNAGAGGSYQLATTQIWTPSAHGANASIWTTPNGTITPVQTWIFQPSGGLTATAATGGDCGSGCGNFHGLQIDGVNVSAGASSINLGSLTTANPHISGDVTSGFYTAGAAEADVGISGVNVAKWTAGGTNLAGTTTANNVTVTGTETANNLTVTGTCTGCGTPAFTNRNTFTGTGALAANTTGTDNAAFGNNSLHVSITDSGNVAVGSGSLANYAVGNTTSSTGGNVAIGTNALGLATTSQDNTVVGNFAGAAITGGGTASQNTLYGAASGKNITGNSANILCLGVNCGSAGASGITINSSKLTIVGDNAGSSIVSATQDSIYGYNAQIGTGGQDSVAMGFNANAQGGNAVAVGSQSASGTAGSNTSVGIGAGKAQTTGGFNTEIGALTGFTTGTTGSHNVLLGSGVNVPAAGTSNYMALGDGGALKATIAAPTISSGFGTSPSIVAGGTSSLAFQVNVGTGGSATSGVIAFTNAMPVGYLCNVADQSTTTSTVFITKSTITSTNTVTLTNYNTSGAAAAWVASDVLNVACNGL